MRVNVAYTVEEEKTTTIDIDEAELVEWLGETSYTSEDVKEFIKASGDIGDILDEKLDTYVTLNAVLL